MWRPYVVRGTKRTDDVDDDDDDDNDNDVMIQKSLCVAD